MSDIADLIVIGGGVNGTAIARDAAGRGLKTILCEKGDLAQATSSASTKLIHGGLRYLEHYEFRLVRESLKERETLLAAAPHIIWPMRFILPHHEGLRPKWMLRLGLFLYDHIGGRKRLPPANAVNLSKDSRGQVLQPGFTSGFEYSDCWVEDSRLVVLNALDAAERGAEILVRTEVVAAKRNSDVWDVTIETPSGSRRTLSGRSLVNAAGPWVSNIISNVIDVPGDLSGGDNLRLVKGSHIVVKRLFEGEHAFIFQNADGRIVFAIPYEQRFTLIGTTEVAFSGDADVAKISEEEVAYLIGAVAAYLKTTIEPRDIVWTYSGVRPLYDDQTEKVSAVTRDYVFDIDGPVGVPPVLSIFGGKITTSRKLAEHALDQLAPIMGWSGQGWTADTPLPGGDIPDTDFNRFTGDVTARYADLPTQLLHRLARAYGTRLDRILADATCPEDLGRSFGAGLTESELLYLIREEWARSAEDVLWRRSKLGLHMSEAERAKVVDWFDKAGGDVTDSMARTAH